MATPTSVSSATSPPALAPAISRQPSLSLKPLAAAGSPAPGTPCTVTTKEWIIPPRPKPGRKPATDTPPTKRKAQNRAAQRAFRERRAARVGELEEQIKEIEDEHDRNVAALEDQIKGLSEQLERSRGDITWWKDRCHALEKDVAVERSAKEALAKEARSSTDAVPLPPRRSGRNTQTRPATETETRRESEQEQLLPAGCGSCSTTHCQCIDDAFNISNITANQETNSSKRVNSQSPRRGGISKRHRQEPAVKAEPEEMEIDFTSRFSSSNYSRPAAIDAVSTSTVVDPCGFCQDGTPCICAEMAADNQAESNRLAPIQNLSQFTPPPSDGDVRPEIHLPPISQAANPCANGPGTCAQCRADPRSTLFCKSLAASRASSAPSGGCCGGRGADGGCCQSRPSVNTNQPPQLNGPKSAPAITLTCADAFTTLSRHPNFARASDELGTWLPRLHTLPNPKDLAPKNPHSQPLNSRPAMEVEAASVMGVLRYFDRRFAEK